MRAFWLIPHLRIADNQGGVVNALAPKVSVNRLSDHAWRASEERTLLFWEDDAAQLALSNLAADRVGSDGFLREFLPHSAYHRPHFGPERSDVAGFPLSLPQTCRADGVAGLSHRPSADLNNSTKPSK